MRIENLLPLLVPLTFIALWAITSIFNRDAQPLPARNLGRPGPGAKPPGAQPHYMPRLSKDFPTSASSASQVPRRPSSTRAPDLVIQDQRSTSPLKEAEAVLRRFSKGRKKAPRKDPLTSTSAGMSRSMGETIGDTVGHGTGLSALELPPSPLLQQSVDPLSTYTQASVSTSKGPTTRDLDIKALVGSRERLQEAWILSEILLPPLSLRKRGR